VATEEKEGKKETVKKRVLTEVVEFQRTSGKKQEEREEKAKVLWREEKQRVSDGGDRGEGQAGTARVIDKKEHWRRHVGGKARGPKRGERGGAPTKKHTLRKLEKLKTKQNPRNKVRNSSGEGGTVEEGRRKKKRHKKEDYSIKKRLSKSKHGESRLLLRKNHPGHSLRAEKEGGQQTEGRAGF